MPRRKVHGYVLTFVDYTLGIRFGESLLAIALSFLVSLLAFRDVLLETGTSEFRCEFVSSTNSA